MTFDRELLIPVLQIRCEKCGEWILDIRAARERHEKSCRGKQ